MPFHNRGLRETGRTTVTADPASQEFIDAQRRQAQRGAGIATGNSPFGIGNESFFTGPLTQTPGQLAQPFFDPFQEQVIGGVRKEFDFLRNQATARTAGQATSAGAGLGGRSAVLEGTRLGALDRAQTSQISGLLSGGFQNALTQGVQFGQDQQQLEAQQLMEPLFRERQAQQFLNLGLGPVGQTQTEFGQRPSVFGSAAGGALTGFGVGGSPGALIGGGLGLLGGLFG